MEARHVYGAWSEASQCTPEVEVFPANSEGSNFLTIDMNSYHQPSKTQYDFVDMSYLLPDVDHAVDNEIIHQEKPTSQEFAQGSTISTSDTSLRDVSQPNSGVDWSLMSLVNTVGGSSHSLDTNTNDLNEQESSGRSEAQTTTISGGIPEMAKTPQGWTIRRTISSIDDVAVGSRKSPQKRSYDSMSGTDEFLKPHSSPMMVDCQVSWGITTSDSTIVSALSCNDGQDCHWTHAGSSILDAGTAVPPATPDDSMAPPPKPQRPALDTGSRQATVAVQSSLSTFVNAHERIYDSGSSTHSNSSLIDDIMLPPAAMQLETASKSNSFTNHDHRPQSKAASEASHSLTSSPAWLTLTSPQIQSPQTCSRTSRKDSAVQRVSSDRRWRTGAVSPSALVSPTVLPKISPNIAPMLTGKGALHNYHIARFAKTKLFQNWWKLKTFLQQSQTTRILSRVHDFQGYHIQNHCQLHLM